MLAILEVWPLLLASESTKLDVYERETTLTCTSTTPLAKSSVVALRSYSAIMHQVRGKEATFYSARSILLDAGYYFHPFSKAAFLLATAT